MANNPPLPAPPACCCTASANLLITEMALECDYGASSIRERNYANDQIFYGILLLTSNSGSEVGFP